MFKKYTFQLFFRHQGSLNVKTALNSNRKFSIPPLHSAARETDVDGLYLGKEAQKIYEIRTYTVKPKYFKEYIKFTEENFHLRIKHSKLFGYWRTELGALNEVIHIWEYGMLIFIFSFNCACHFFSIDGLMNFKCNFYIMSSFF